MPIILKFPNFLELLSFAVMMGNEEFTINRFDLTLRGNFPEVDIKLALHTFQALLVERDEQVFKSGTASMKS